MYFLSIKIFFESRKTHQNEIRVKLEIVRVLDYDSGLGVYSSNVCMDTLEKLMQYNVGLQAIKQKNKLHPHSDLYTNYL